MVSIPLPYLVGDGGSIPPHTERSVQPLNEQNKTKQKLKIIYHFKGK
jgi:hypothetical protein